MGKLENAQDNGEVPRPKVFNLGLPKSGTTTLAKALREAGYKVADWRVPKIGYVGPSLYYHYFKNHDPLKALSEYNAFTQMDIVRDGRNSWPQCDFGLLQAIRKYHPTAKFLLSYRDAAALSDSMRRWSDLGSKRLKLHEIPGLPIGYGTKDLHRIKWIEAHYAFLRMVFKDDPNFLEYEVSDPEASAKLVKFLGHDLPWWGRANANKNQVNPELVEELQPETPGGVA